MFIICSCHSTIPTHPETVLGIKLGLPKAQMLEITNSGKLKFEDEKSYINYGEFRGYLTADTVISSEGSFIDCVKLKFINLDLNTDKARDWEYVSEFNLNQIISSYEIKYGTPHESEDKKSLIQIRSWYIGDLNIGLFTDCHLEWGGVKRCKAEVVYGYTLDGYKIFKAYLEKNNKGI